MLAAVLAIGLIAINHKGSLSFLSVDSGRFSRRHAITLSRLDCMANIGTCFVL